MKHRNFFLTLMLTISLNALAGIPNGYYSSIDGLKSTELKTALKNIISQHETLSYNNLWDYYPFTYYVIEDEDQVLDMYSAETYYFTNHSNMDREHVVPKAWWGGSTDDGPGCDIYNVIPADHTANNAKSDYPFGEVTGTVYFDNGVSKVGQYTSDNYTGRVFEPADVYKGDFARICFYVATCYPDVEWDANDAIMMTNTSELTLYEWVTPMLISWSTADPVDSGEIQRNEDVCKYQSNRNPFIDYPELVDYIWGDKSGETFVLSEHTANEGSSNDNMRTERPTFSVEYGTEDSPKGVAIGSEVTITGGTRYSTLHTRINSGNWEETEPTLGYNDSHVAATKTYTISELSCIEAYCTREGYDASYTLTAYYTPIDYDNLYLLYEAFDEITTGNDTSTSGSSTSWAGNDNFPMVEKVYNAGGTLRLGTSSAIGSITSRTLDTEGGIITVDFDVKGWTTIEGNLTVTVSGATTQTVSYTAKLEDEYEHISLEFTGVSAYPTLTISTTAKRAFIDNIIVDGTPTGIQRVEATHSSNSAPIYNIQGIRVTDTKRKGIYIQDGHKVLR